VIVGDDTKNVVDVTVIMVVFGFVSAVVAGVVPIVVVFTVDTFVVRLVVGAAVSRTIILKQTYTEKAY